jgi:putative tricarboxylic transport membrane protein
MQLSDRVTGLFLVALGAVTAVAGSRLPPVPGQQIGPNVFPMVIGVGLCLCGGLIAFHVGRGFEEGAGSDLAPQAGEGGGSQNEGTGWRQLMALLPPALLVLYVFAVDRLGFLLTAGSITLVTALALGARVRLAVPLALLAPPAVHVVFSKLLRVPLPTGLIPTPW